jgi:hypothetical protein
MALSGAHAVATERSWVSTFFGHKIHRIELEARRFHPYSIMKAFLRSFRPILLHLIVVLCVLFIGWHVETRLSTGSHHYAGQFS